MPEANLTDRQQKWFATIRAGLERDTGKSMDEWVAIVRTCPEEGHRARLKWLKDHHGLLQNRASQVLSEAFGSRMAWSEPDKLIEALWTDPASRTIFQAIDAAARQPNEVIQTARKGYTAWSRKVQFAAARPIKGGKAMLGLAVPPDTGARLEAPKNESWSERLKARVLLSSPAEVDAEIEALLKEAWQNAG
ncbi:MAG TPA: DUF4287 domain-containing protein [Caulobacteraceae bacterium]